MTKLESRFQASTDTPAGQIERLFTSNTGLLKFILLQLLIQIKQKTTSEIRVEIGLR